MITVIKKGSDPKKVSEKLEKHYKDHKKGKIKSLCGVLNLKTDPVVLQRKWRDEWK